MAWQPVATWQSVATWQALDTVTGVDTNFNSTAANQYGSYQIICSTGGVTIVETSCEPHYTCCGQVVYGTTGQSIFGYLSNYIFQNHIAWCRPQDNPWTGAQEDYRWVYVPTEETPEQAAAREKRARGREVAESRADQLLMNFLSSDQADQYRREQRFELTINGRQYRIKKGRSGNVQLIENGQPVARYCAHPEIWTPDGDTMLAQLLMLKTDEARFLEIANRTSLV